MTTKRKMIHTYLTDEQKRKLEGHAKVAGMSVSKYIIHKLQLSDNITEDVTSIRHMVYKPDRTDPTHPVPPANGVPRGPYIAPPKITKQ